MQCITAYICRDDEHFSTVVVETRLKNKDVNIFAKKCVFVYYCSMRCDPLCIDVLLSLGLLYIYIVSCPLQENSHSISLLS